MDEVDNLLKKILSKKIYSPQSFQNTIENALKKEEIRKEKKIIKFRIPQLVATSVAFILLTTSIVFGKEIANFVQNVFNKNGGIEKAIQNGYIYNPNMEYVNLDNMKVKIDNFLMDDYNLSFILNINLEKQDISKFDQILFSDMIITDELNKILYCNNKDTFDLFCKENNLNYEFGEFNENYINSGMNYYIKSKENNILELVFNLYSNQYPKSKKFNIYFSKIDITKYDKSNTQINGKCNIEIDIPEKFYNRQGIVYHVKSCSDNSLNIKEIVVYDTGMLFEFDTKLTPIYTDKDTEEIIQQRKNEFFEWGSNLKTKFVMNEYIIDSNGVEYFPSNSDSESSGTIYEPNGNYRHWQTFNITKYDAPTELILYFTMNSMEKSNNVKIELERNK